MPRIPLLVAAAALVAGPLHAQKTDDSFAWTGPIAAGRTLEVRGINGNLEVRLASGGGAAVHARHEQGREMDQHLALQGVEQRPVGDVPREVHVLRVPHAQALGLVVEPDGRAVREE